ncbi:hypothetical protein [Leifsonia aquatica]|uniref:hypothetical protein n=1 Tax=Leifsonia aquatica TaxID=144185 RepID=UPI000468D5D3|nr:hypothetical protein [Leifsonia aquatica]
MSVPPDDEVVVTDGPSAPRARFYHWMLDHLAKFPGRVTVVTFAAGVVVTVIVVLFGGDASPTGVVGLIATLWALFFAVMIYLLTARDTDTVLEQIADLHEQLATALASPDGDDGGGDEEGEEGEEGEDGTAGPGSTEPEPERPAAGGPAQNQEAPAVPSLPVPAPLPSPARGGGRPAHGDRTREPGAAHGASRVLTGAADIAAGVPPELLEAWRSATGGSTGDLERVWTRDPRSDRQWVFETAQGERWVVFSRGAQGTGVISLSDPPVSGFGRRPSVRRPARGEGNPRRNG